MSIYSIISDDLQCCCLIGTENQDLEHKKSRLLTPVLRRGVFEEPDQLSHGHGSTRSLYSSRETLKHEKSQESSFSARIRSKLVAVEMPFIAELYADPVFSTQPTRVAPTSQRGNHGRATDFIAELQNPSLINANQIALSPHPAPPKNLHHTPSFIAEMVDQHNSSFDDSDSDDDSTPPPPPLVEGWTEEEQANFLAALRTIGAPSGRRTSGLGFREWMAAVSAEVCRAVRYDQMKGS
jgi:hypothetical protein